MTTKDNTTNKEKIGKMAELYYRDRIRQQAYADWSKATSHHESRGLSMDHDAVAKTAFCIYKNRQEQEAFKDWMLAVHIFDLCANNGLSGNLDSETITEIIRPIANAIYNARQQAIRDLDWFNAEKNIIS